MPDKLPSEIIRITLDDATYKGTGAAIAPTYINYFFGNNGTGKTTIAKAIKTGSGVIYAPGKAAADYLPLVYDQDFIDANMRNYHNLPGVFTMNEANVKIQEQIDRKAAEQKKAQKISSDAFAEKDKKAKTKAALEKQLYKDCWDKTEELRTVFEATQEGKKGSKQKFAEEVKRHSPIQHDVEELKRMYDSVYSSTAKRYGRFSVVSDVSALDRISGCDILSLAIVNTSNTPFADFLKEVGSTEWVRQGHADYHEKAGGKCPYCSRDLPQNFEEMLAASFDTQYQTNLQKLDAFLAAYRDMANALFVPLSRLPDEVYPVIDTKPYHDKLTAVKAVIAENIEKIKSKVVKPSKIIALDEVEPLLQELSDIISSFNRLIDANNDIVSAGPKKKAECKKAVFEQIAYTLKDVLEISFILLLYNIQHFAVTYRKLWLLSDICQNTAVNIKNMSVYKIGCIRCKKYCRAAEIIGFSPSFRRCLCQYKAVKRMTRTIRLALSQRCRLRCCNISGTNAVALNII